MREVLKVERASADPGGGGAVVGWSLTVGAGEVVALVGPRARVRTAGRIAAGVLIPATGSVTIAGVPLGGGTAEARVRACWVDGSGVLPVRREAAAKLLATMYAGWSDDRYDDVLGQIQAQRLGFWENAWTRKPWLVRRQAALGLATGAPVVVLDRPFRGVAKSERGQWLATLSQAARSVGAALILAVGEREGLSDVVDRVVEVPAPSRAAPEPSAAQPGETDARMARRLALWALTPRLPTALPTLILHVGALAIVGRIGRDQAMLWGAMPVILGHLYAVEWLTGGWSPPAAFSDGLNGPWGPWGASVPASPGTIVRARHWVVLGRSIGVAALPLMLLLRGDAGWMLQGALGAFAPNGPIPPVLFAPVLLTPLVATLHRIPGGVARGVVAAAGVGLLLGLAAAGAGTPHAPRGVAVGLLSAGSLATILAAWVLGLVWLANTATTAGQGSIRGRRTWHPAAVAAGLALCTAWPLVVRSAIPPITWQDLPFARISLLDASAAVVCPQGLAASLDPPFDTMPCSAIDLETWAATPLGTAREVVAMGDEYGRLHAEGGRRWLEIAPSWSGPARLVGEPWTGKAGSLRAFGDLLSASRGGKTLGWLDSDGAEGTIELPRDAILRWGLVRSEGSVTFEALGEQAPCPEGTKRMGTTIFGVVICRGDRDVLLVRDVAGDLRTYAYPVDHHHQPRGFWRSPNGTHLWSGGGGHIHLWRLTEDGHLEELPHLPAYFGTWIDDGKILLEPPAPHLRGPLAVCTVDGRCRHPPLH